MSRRNFLKVLGASSAAGAAGCATDKQQNIYSYVKGEAEQIPGVAVWYSSTCTECTAGCGIQVRTREGRAVKVEGNPRNPIGSGGLCALGQASLQHLYDPDRIRQPLKRVSGVGATARFEPISWDEASAQVSAALKESLKEGKKRAVLTGEMTGAISELVSEWSSNFSADHVTYDVLQPVALAKASELVFGVYGIPEYSIDKAEVLLNFGADFLETWVSPVQFARQWADSRRSAKPVRVIQVEPRLSLSGANADQWLMNKPGTEVRIALAVLKILVESGRGSNLSPEVREQISGLVKGVSVGAVASEAGIEEQKIVLVAHYLNSAKTSLVIGGGAAAATQDALSLLVAVNLINSVLGNVGATINLSRMRVPKTSLAKMTKLVGDMDSGNISMVLLHGTNPAFTLPSDYGFEYALRKVPLVVSLSSHLDETSKNANLILPSHSGLESWGDVRPFEGHYSLVQPAMAPVFSTRDLGDNLIKLAKAAGKEISGKGISGRSGGAFSPEGFFEYLQESWKAVSRTHGVSSDFATFWLESVERGGFFPGALAEQDPSERVRVKVDKASFALNFSAPEFSDPYPAGKSEAGGFELTVMPYPSVKSFDGRAANRPWLQELADPITQLVWNSWAEIHPDTAAKVGVEQGDVITLRNFYGEINVPVLVSPYVRQEMVAVPLGQGHQGYGRYAQQVGGGNVLSLVAKGASDKAGAAKSGDTKSGDAVALLSTKVRGFRAPGRAKLTKLMGSDFQHGRDIARTSLISEDSTGGLTTKQSYAHEHSHEIKQMYQQREHPMYEWGMTIDLAACTGCSACVVACYAENNIPVVGAQRISEGREMSWIRIERYYDNHGATNTEAPAPEELSVSFLPMMCQHCNNAPCEPVCPVYATYHNEEGLNAMVYNRCVGTRYCSNNCSYKVRRFNWYDYEFPEPLNMQLNPDVTKRIVGIMEKCTFCVQRIVEGKDHAKDEGRMVKDGEVQPACVQSCPTQALTFGNLKDMGSAVVKKRQSARAYKVLDYYVNTQPAVSYLERLRYTRT
jgi:molybdopterin-containing oxidoreductase family iron-sulfur binding subunit